MNNTLSEHHSHKFLSDKDIEIMLSISPSWVRKQRHLRKNQEDHLFEIDPIYFGRSPRYRAEDVGAWIGQR